MTQRVGRVGFALLLAASSAGCPTNSARVASETGLDPASGPPHTVVMVSGTQLQNASVIWDADTDHSRTLPLGLGGASMFSVPPDATAEAHQVAVVNSSGRLGTYTFTVKARPVPAPRLDYVTIIDAGFDGGHMNVLLYVQGANLDVGSVVSIDGEELPTTAHKALRNDWHGVTESELGYPIDHYLANVVVAGFRLPNTVVNVTVKNLDGQQSDPFPYRFAADAASLDSDGDGLPDAWERDGYSANDNGTIDVDLHALGADPGRRDLFMQLDIMDNVPHRPGPAVFDALKAMFAAAPILNYAADPGIHLVIDLSGKPCLRTTAGGAPRCSFHWVRFDTGGPDTCPHATATETTGTTPGDAVNYSDLKCASFDNNKRGAIYHYGIWGIGYSGGSGESDMADDFLVAFDESPFGDAFHTPRTQLERLAHEFGHDLRQKHAGLLDEPAYKPNYWSVMAYTWDMRTGWDAAERIARATCLPFYYEADGADEVSGAVPSSVATITDYSEGMARSIQRTGGVVTTVCGKPVDWDGSHYSGGRLDDFPNWRALEYDGPARNGWPAPQDGIRP